MLEQKMMVIPQEFNEPSISNIGQDGSETSSILALHSYLDEMNKVVAACQVASERNSKTYA